jgi:hypothetical protein
MPTAARLAALLLVLASALLPLPAASAQTRAEITTSRTIDRMVLTFDRGWAKAERFTQNTERQLNTLRSRGVAQDRVLLTEERCILKLERFVEGLRRNIDKLEASALITIERLAARTGENISEMRADIIASAADIRQGINTATAMSIQRMRLASGRVTE